MDSRIALMSVVVGIAVLGGVFLSTSASVFDQGSNTQSEGTSIMGHVTLVVYDPEGNIKTYIQGDNVIQDKGENCIVEMMTALTSYSCSGSNLPFLTVHIGNSATAATEQQNALIGSVTFEAGTAVLNTVATGGSAALYDVVASFSDPGAVNFKEAGLADTDGNFLAREVFGTTATLGASDDLVITWTITIGA